MIEALIELISAIWRGDSSLREQSQIGESELDSKSRRVVGCICGTTIFILVGVGLAWWWVTR